MKERFIAVISDTHAMLRPEVKTQLLGAEAIIHAGDVGSEDIYDRLRYIAPLHAVRGNIDALSWGDCLPATEAVKIEDKYFYVVHSLDCLDISPKAAGFDYVIYGHSHRPALSEKGGVVYLNPGSCGPRRFDLPVSMAKIHITEGGLHPELIELDVSLY